MNKDLIRELANLNPSPSFIKLTEDMMQDAAKRIAEGFDYEQWKIKFSCIKLIRYRMKKYFSYGWDQEATTHILEHIGNEIYYSQRISSNDGIRIVDYGGICHLKNYYLLLIVKHYLAN